MKTKKDILELITTIGFIKLKVGKSEIYSYYNPKEYVYATFWIDGNIRIYYDNMNDIVSDNDYDKVYIALKKQFNTELRKSTIKKLLNE